MKKIEWRIQARHDAAQAAYWYARQAGVGVGERFLAQVDRTLGLIAQHLASGSTRHAAFAMTNPKPDTKKQRTILQMPKKPKHQRAYP